MLPPLLVWLPERTLPLLGPPCVLQDDIMYSTL